MLFAIGRAPGWLAQWNELVQDQDEIARPKQIYTGDRTLEVRARVTALGLSGAKAPRCDENPGQVE